MFKKVAQLGKWIEGRWNKFVDWLPESWAEALSHPWHNDLDFDEVGPIDRAMGAADARHFTSAKPATDSPITFESLMQRFFTNFNVWADAEPEVRRLIQEQYNIMALLDRPAYVTFAAALALAFGDHRFNQLLENAIGDDMPFYREMVPYHIGNDTFWANFQRIEGTVPTHVLVWRAVCWTCLCIHGTTRSPEWITSEKAEEVHERVATLISQSHLVPDILISSDDPVETTIRDAETEQREQREAEWDALWAAFLQYFGVQTETAIPELLMATLKTIYDDLSRFEQPTHVTFAAALAQAFADVNDFSSWLVTDTFVFDMDFYKDMLSRNATEPEFWNQFAHFAPYTVHANILAWRATCWVCLHLSRQEGEPSDYWKKPENVAKIREEVVGLLISADLMI